MREVHQGEFYRHFKDRLYQIVAVAEHSETGERMVVYQALYGDYRVYVRPYEMFVSEVDHEKYPQVTQKYRFERVDPGAAAASAQSGDELADGSQSRPEQPECVQPEFEPPERVRPQPEPLRAEPPRPEQPVGINPILSEFLDAETMQDKMHIMVFYRNQMDAELLNSIAISLDLVLDKKPLQAQYDEIMKCLTMKQKFEYSRNR